MHFVQLADCEKRNRHVGSTPLLCVVADAPWCALPTLPSMWFLAPAGPGLGCGSPYPSLLWKSHRSMELNQIIT